MQACRELFDPIKTKSVTDIGGRLSQHSCCPAIPGKVDSIRGPEDRKHAGKPALVIENRCAQ